MTNRKSRTPAEVWPLAYYLAEEMKERGWTAADVGARMGTGDGAAMDTLTLSLTLAIHEDNALIGDETLAGLARAFGVSADYFRSLDDAWRDNPAARVAWECPEELLRPSP